MKFIQGQSREQINLFPISLDRSIDPDNEVRIIDLLVASLSIKDYGFLRGISLICDGKLLFGIQMPVRNRLSLKPL